jgi:hypothetical protein
MLVRREDWELLVRLPGRLVVAVTVAEREAPASRAVAEGIAGVDAIAAGRLSASRLVRDVVAAIYDETGDEPVTVPEMPGPATAVAEFTIACRSAATVLDERVGREDADAYQHWLESIAARVCRAAHAGEVFSPVRSYPGEVERRFLDAVSTAFGR